MSKNKIFNYHQIVIILYLILVPMALLVFDWNLSFSPNFNKLDFLLFFVSQIILVTYLYGHSRYEGLSIKKFFLFLSYGTLFSLPEEVLFRGFIQGFVLNGFDPWYSIIISSLFFGFAHLYNGAKSYRLSSWNFNLMFLSFLGGLPLGYLFYSTGSLSMPICLHIMFLFWMQIFRK